MYYRETVSHSVVLVTISHSAKQLPTYQVQYFAGHMFESRLGGIHKHVATEGGVKNLGKPGNKVATKGGGIKNS